MFNKKVIYYCLIGIYVFYANLGWSDNCENKLENGDFSHDTNRWEMIGYVSGILHHDAATQSAKIIRQMTKYERDIQGVHIHPDEAIKRREKYTLKLKHKLVGENDLEIWIRMNGGTPVSITPHSANVWLDVEVEITSGEQFSSLDIYTTHGEPGDIYLFDDVKIFKGECDVEHGDHKYGTWTDWRSRDIPTLTGDWERLWDFNNNSPFPIPCTDPIGVEARTVDSHIPHSATHYSLLFGVPYGLVCVNADQANRTCGNFEVRFLCPDTNRPQPIPEWTQWLMRDDNDASGVNAELEYFSEAQVPCKHHVLDVQARTLNGKTPHEAGEVVLMNKHFGFICRNIDQEDDVCENYRVRFRCR